MGEGQLQVPGGSRDDDQGDGQRAQHGQADPRPYGHGAFQPGRQPQRPRRRPLARGVLVAAAETVTVTVTVTEAGAVAVAVAGARLLAGGHRAASAAARSSARTRSITRANVSSRAVGSTPSGCTRSVVIPARR